MHSFKETLKQSREIGFVVQAIESIVYVDGLPGVHPGEVVIFDNDQLGYVVGIEQTSCEVLPLSEERVNVGMQVTRTGSQYKIKVTDDLLGKTLGLKEMAEDLLDLSGSPEARGIDIHSPTFSERAAITEPLDTGVTIVDLLVPLAKGQRELVIGDRKTGKTNVLLQAILTQAQQGSICIYAGIGKPQLKIRNITRFFEKNGIQNQTMIIASEAAQRPGLVYLTPYIAMAVAEHFRDQGKHVLLVMDDLTTHARYYREVMLLAKRFPGRSSYPGDIFHLHARLLERAGSFKKGVITCLPIAHAVQGDLSGYIQTNLMGMTDGHIYFDTDLFDQGRRPAINAFLSVTRVGQQTQTPLQRNIGREIRAFFVHFEKVKQFKHFQTELGESIQEVFNRGERLLELLDQPADLIVPVKVNTALCGALWADLWKNVTPVEMKKHTIALIEKYKKDAAFQKEVDALVDAAKTFPELVSSIQTKSQLFISTEQAAGPTPVEETPIQNQVPEGQAPNQPTMQAIPSAEAEAKLAQPTPAVEPTQPVPAETATPPTATPAQPPLEKPEDAK